MSIFRTYKDIDRGPQEPLAKQINSDNYLLKCDLCKKSFINDTELEVHRRIVHGDVLSDISKLPYCCKMCIRDYKNVEDLVKHTKTHHLLSTEDGTQVEKEIFVCDYCSQIFFSKALLAAHISLGHMLVLNEERQKMTLDCPKCHRWVKLCNIPLHFQGHMYDVFCCCPICMELFNKHEDIYLHSKSHPSVLTCECGMKFTKYSLYNKHRLSHKRKILHIKCTDYKKYFATHPDSNLCANFRSIFKQIMLNGVVLPNCVNVCVLCKHICTNEFTMKYHITQDHNIEDTQTNTYTCDCGMEFTNKVLLKQHQLNVHTAETHEITEPNAVIEFCDSGSTKDLDNYISESKEDSEVNTEMPVLFS